jgi:hypothetical protein
LAVPGVQELVLHTCGTASVIAVIKYYNPGYRDPAIYDADKNGAISVNCLLYAYLNSHTNGKATDFILTNSVKAEHPPNPVITLDTVKKSILSGDPVILYTKKGGVYDNIQHIIVLSGWNEQTKRFYVMNPFIDRNPNSINYEENTETPHGKAMTEEHIMQFIGDQGGGPFPDRAFIIRKKYVH